MSASRWFPSGGIACLGLAMIPPMPKCRLPAIALLAALFSSPIAAATAVPVLETLVVTGIQPGPGLWQVRHGTHTLWIMGTLSPLPRRMEWEPRELDERVANADRVLAPPRGGIDTGLNLFGRLTLLPAALRARNLPDSQRLADVLPPELYARWQVQKARWIGEAPVLERRRPMFAAFALMEEALEDLDLERENIVWQRVERIARREGREIVRVRVEARLDDPRQALREFNSGGFDDLACLEATLARLEQDTGLLVERANAWAVGDTATLLERRFDDELRACALAVLATEAAKKRGLDTLPQRLVEAWLQAASESLETTANTVAVSDLRLLLADDGLLAGLRARGYLVLPPGETLPEDAADDAADDDTADRHPVQPTSGLLR